MRDAGVDGELGCGWKGNDAHSSGDAHVCEAYIVYNDGVDGR